MIYAVILALMTQALLAVFIVIEQRRQMEQIHMLVQYASPDLCEMVALVDRLCQRIQAPDVAVAEHAYGAYGEEDALPSVSMFDDQDYHESKEELAARLDAEAMSGTT